MSRQRIIPESFIDGVTLVGDGSIDNPVRSTGGGPPPTPPPLSEYLSVSGATGTVLNPNIVTTYILDDGDGLQVWSLSPPTLDGQEKNVVIVGVPVNSEFPTFSLVGSAFAGYGSPTWGLASEGCVVPVWYRLVWSTTDARWVVSGPLTGVPFVP